MTGKAEQEERGSPGKRRRRGRSAAAYFLLPDLFGPAARALGEGLGAQRSVFGALRRAFGSIGKLERPRGWPGALGVAMALAGLAWIALAVVEMAAGTSPAAAQTPPVPDLSGEPDQAGRKLLAFLADLDTGSGSALSNMLAVYGGAMLVLGGVILVWSTVSAVTETASEGKWKFKGKEALRIAVAFMLMVPLFGGLSGGQHIGLALARLGGDVAQLTWSEFSQGVLGEGRIVAPSPGQREVRSMLASLFLVELCAATANMAAAEAGDDPYVVVRSEEHVDGIVEPGRGVSEIRRRSESYDGRAGGMPEGMCGAFGQAGIDGGATAGGKMSEAHYAALQAVRPALRRIAGDIALWFAAPPGQVRRDGPLTDIEEALVRADPAGAYLTQVRAAAEATRDEATRVLWDQLQADAGTLPWTMAASLFMTITRHVGEYHVGAGNIPSVSLPSTRLAELVRQADAAVRAAAEQLGSSNEYPAAIGVSADPAGGSGSFGGIGRGSFDWLDLDNIEFVDSGNPVMDLVSLGYSLVTKGLGALTTLGLVAAGSNVLESIPLVGGGLDKFEAVWQVADSMVSTVLGLMILAGLVLAYLVPVLPFLRFLFGLLAWLVAVIAAVFAIPVWLAGHMVRGDSFVTASTRQGWLFLPGLVLRPVLMLFGLVVGYLLFVTIMDSFNEVFRRLVFDAGASRGIGVLGWLAMLAVYLMTVYGLMNACFKLIDHLPAVAMDWIGGRDRGDGETDRVGGGIAGAFGRVGPMRVGRRGRGGRGGRPGESDTGGAEDALG